jgi:hypothetical protein
MALRTPARDPEAEQPRFGPHGSQSDDPGGNRNDGWEDQPAAGPMPDGMPDDPFNESLGDDSDPRGEGSDKVRSAADILNDEENPDKPKQDDDEDEDKEAGLFNPNDSKQRGNINLVLRAAGSGNKKGKSTRLILLGAGAGAGVVATFVVVFFMLIPLKVEHIIKNLEKDFESTSNNAVDEETQKMLSNYIKHHVLPALTKCSGSTIDKNCNPHFANTDNPVTALYKGWSDARLEHTLATKYGIEFRKYFAKAPGLNPDGGDDITKFVGPGDDKDLFQEVGRGKIRELERNAIKEMSLWQNVKYRFGERLSDKKYGIDRCNFFCGTRDRLADKKNAQINAAQLYIAERVLQPRSEMLFIVLQCLLDSSCDPGKTTANNPDDAAKGETGGAPVSDVETKGQKKFREMAAKAGVDNIETAQKLYNDIAEKGYQQAALEFILIRLFGEDSGKVAAGNVVDAVPFVGEINIAAQVVDFANDTGPKAKKLAFMTNAPATVKLLQFFRTGASEEHLGKNTAEEIGSEVKAFGPGKLGPVGDPQVGGTASAEETPLYGQLIDHNTTKSYGKNYTCNDGNPVPKGQVVCSEEILGQGNGSLNDIHSFISKVPIIPQLANVWTTVSSVPANLAGKIFEKPFQLTLKFAELIPGVKAVEGAATSAAGDVMTALVNKLIPNPFGGSMSGGRTFDMVAAGMSVMGHDSCDQIGCASVSSDKVASIINEEMAKDKQDFDHQPLFARMFGTDSQYSLVSRVAMATPISLSTNFGSTFMSVFNPISGLSHNFGSLFSGPSAAAATIDPMTVDPFKIGTTAMVHIPNDPEKYWDDNNCGDTSDNGPIAKWQQAASDGPKDPNTGMPIHETDQPCLLIKNTASWNGAVFDTSLLSPDEQEILGSTV